MIDIDWSKAKVLHRKDGYIMLRIYKNGIRYSKPQHVYLWECVNGKVPKGHEIHHINEIKHDNDISNLMLVTPLIHRRIHSGWKIIDGEWWKTCNFCNRFMLIKGNFYKAGKRNYGECIECTKIYKKEYELNNPEKIKEWNERKKPRAKIHSKEFYEENKEEKLKWQKEYYFSHKEERISYAKRYRELNKEKIQLKSKIRRENKKRGVKNVIINDTI